MRRYYTPSTPTLLFIPSVFPRHSKKTKTGRSTDDSVKSLTVVQGKPELHLEYLGQGGLNEVFLPTSTE